MAPWKTAKQYSESKSLNDKGKQNIGMHSMAPITYSLTMGDVVQRVKMSKIVTHEICPVHLCTVHCHGLPSNLDLVLFSIDFTIKLINQQSPFCNFGHKFYRPLITWLLRLLLWYLLNQHLASQSI